MGQIDKKDSIILCSTKATISEVESDPDVYICKFILCDFSINKNGVGLNRDTIADWMSTIKTRPIVGKIKAKYDGSGEDFTDHAAKVVKKFDENNNSYDELVFDSDAFGTITDAAIETIDGVECLVATATIWKRFEKACAIMLRRIANGTLSTSWEISIVDATQKFANGSIVRIINQGRFLGHALLGELVDPAFPVSRLLDIAQENSQDVELQNALVQDILCSHIISNEQEVTMKKELSNVNTPVAEDVNTQEGNPTPEPQPESEVPISTDQQQKTETSALTEWDLRDRLREACAKKLKDRYCWIAYHFPVEKTVWIEDSERESELDFVLFTYEVAGDDVTVSEPTPVKLTVSVSEFNSTIETLKAELEAKDNTIVELNSANQALSQYKDKFEKAEQVRVEQELEGSRAELRTFAEASKCFTPEELDSGEVATLIKDVKTTELKAVIADRIVASMTTVKGIETSTKKDPLVKRESVETNTPIDYSGAVRAFLKSPNK